MTTMAPGQRQEQSSLLRLALCRHRAAVGWSVLMAISVILVGYSQALLTSLIFHPEFSKIFGDLYLDEYDSDSYDAVHKRMPTN